jgi:tetratricopeptide (TPR) repeat protein
MAAKKRKKRRPQRVPSNTRHVPKKPTSDQLIQSEYEITAEPLDSPYLKRLPAQVKDTLEDLYAKAQRQPKEAIPDLERLVATYPQVPLFSNYLSVAYSQVGDVEKSEACVLEAYRRHPTYLFARVNYANICLQKGDIATIPEIFDHKLDLKRLYPRRKRFHVSEFTGFAGVMCRYYEAIGEREAAVIYYQILQQLAPRHPLTKQAKRLLYPPFWIRWLRQWAEKRLAEPTDKIQSQTETHRME